MRHVAVPAVAVLLWKRLAYILARILVPGRMRSSRAHLIALIMVTLHAFYSPRCSAAPHASEYCMETAGKTYCVPAVTVLGLPKAATSAITVYLMEHPRLQLMHDTKESCPPGDSFTVGSAPPVEGANMCPITRICYSGINDRQ